LLHAVRKGIASFAIVVDAKDDAAKSLLRTRELSSIFGSADEAVSTSHSEIV
jgi:hypothetical protein